eukprot:CAMPEP_0117444156 /NCGR_PEP_ID=MMETSP0759-20121206/5084_1 /TAXON_ID=63605 /ORGANISM="Percolomonas cosmopolitus, Strain WS" /LENGTH=55 /DNA_ID=CAMNT_0005236191 /DNA_START=511 /DNA_END=678 /DNA_ORIENTATION=+
MNKNLEELAEPNSATIDSRCVLYFAQTVQMQDNSVCDSIGEPSHDLRSKVGKKEQ